MSEQINVEKILNRPVTLLNTSITHVRSRRYQFEKECFMLTQSQKGRFQYSYVFTSSKTQSHRQSQVSEIIIFGVYISKEANENLHHHKTLTGRLVPREASCYFSRLFYSDIRRGGGQQSQYQLKAASISARALGT